MLFRLVEKTCAKLDALDVQRDAPGMMRQILAVRPQRDPDLRDVASFAPEGVPLDELRTFLSGAEKRVAAMMVTGVKESAPIGDSEQAALDQNHITVARRGREPGHRQRFPWITVTAASRGPACTAAIRSRR